MQSASGTILVVEDEPILRMVLADHLAELGYRTLEAAHGEAALPILAGDTDLVLMITDVDMPGLDGRALAAEARRLRPHLGIVFVSGDAGAMPRWPGYDAARMRAIMKPFRAAELAAAIKDLAACPSIGAARQ